MNRSFLRKLMAGGVCLSLVLGLILPALPVLAATSISIGTGNVEVNAGATVTMAITFADVPADLAPSSIDLRLEYNKDVVNVDAVTSGDYAALDTAIGNPNGRTEMLGEDPMGTKSGAFIFANVTLRAVGAPGSSCTLHLNIMELVHNETAISLDSTIDRTFTISGQGEPHTITANPDTYSTNINTALNTPASGVLANDTDSRGHPLTVAEPRPTIGPAHGTLTLNADGSFLYTPTTGFTGTDSFTYNASDDTAVSSVATVTITVSSASAPDDTVMGGSNPSSSTTSPADSSDLSSSSGDSSDSSSGSGDSSESSASGGSSGSEDTDSSAPIAIIVVASVCGIALVSAGIWFLLRRSRRATS